MKNLSPRTPSPVSVQFHNGVLALLQAAAFLRPKKGFIGDANAGSASDESDLACCLETALVMARADSLVKVVVWDVAQYSIMGCRHKCFMRN